MESSLWFTVSVEVIVWLAHVFAFTALELVGNALRPGEMKKTFTLSLRHGSYAGTGIYIFIEVLGYFDLV
jgi:hypothetical protein